MVRTAAADPNHEGAATATTASHGAQRTLYPTACPFARRPVPCLVSPGTALDTKAQTLKLNPVRTMRHPFLLVPLLRNNRMMPTTQLQAQRYRFSRNDKNTEVLEYDPALLGDGRVLGAGFRKSSPELWVPTKVGPLQWLRSGLWYDSTAFSTGLRVVVPAFLAGILSLICFVPVCANFAHVSSPVLKEVAPLVGIIFSILTNFTFQAMYAQQEAALLFLFQEISCAKSLVEQILLVFGHPSPAANRALNCVRQYCARDLRRRSTASAKQLRLALPPGRNEGHQDPLEELLYLSSVDGDPSAHVYATVKELRKLRANRLGALERKLPPVHFVMLYGLGFLLLFGFVLDVAGRQASVAVRAALKLETFVFAVAAFALTACLRVLQDIWSPKSGAYNVDAILVTCVTGLELQLNDLLNTDDDLLAPAAV